jgi:hypothetical protein
MRENQDETLPDGSAMWRTDDGRNGNHSKDRPAVARVSFGLSLSAAELFA